VNSVLAPHPRDRNPGDPVRSADAQHGVDLTPPVRPPMRHPPPSSSPSRGASTAGPGCSGSAVAIAVSCPWSLVHRGGRRHLPCREPYVPVVAKPVTSSIRAPCNMVLAMAEIFALLLGEITSSGVWSCAGIVWSP